jgi:hypothetical protein
MVISDVTHYFNFLVKDFAFSGPWEFSWGHESHVCYIKGKCIIDIGYDGGYFVHLAITKSYIPELESGKMNISEVSANQWRYYSINSLQSKKDSNHSFSPLDEAAQLIKMNSEILHGDVRKYSFFYRFMHMFN